MGHLVSPHQIQKAIARLVEKGVHMPTTSDAREVAGMIAMVEGKPIPSNGAVSTVIWDFIAGGNTPTAEPRPFQPLNYAKAMGPVLERINPDRETKHSAGRLWNAGNNGYRGSK